MDSFYFIGYRIDIVAEIDYWSAENLDFLKSVGAGMFPGEEWFAWLSVDPDVGMSLLAMNVELNGEGDKIPYDYRCPATCEEIYEDLLKRPIDQPECAPEALLPIYRHQTMITCVEKWGIDNVHVRWGIFMGVA